MQNREILIQEDLMREPYGSWKVLVACLCLNRTTWMQAEPVIMRILQKYPTPQDMDYRPMTYVREMGVMRDLQEKLRPLGFASSREERMTTMSRQYLRAKEGLGDCYEAYPIKSFKGCGKYADDAWKLFVLKIPCRPTDKQLIRYAEKVGLLETL